MVLNSKTAGSLQHGDLLKFADGSGVVTVVSVHHCRGGYQLTVDFANGRRLYAEKASAFYGSSIVKGGSDNV